jgi:hypothetical protein
VAISAALTSIGRTEACHLFAVVRPDRGDFDMGDRTTKILLGLIAIGIWANLLISPSHHVASALAASSQMEMYVAAIYNGTCVNHKIC